MYNPTTKVHQNSNKRSTLNVNKYNAFKSFIETTEATLEVQKTLNSE